MKLASWRTSPHHPHRRHLGTLYIHQQRRMNGFVNKAPNLRNLRHILITYLLIVGSSITDVLPFCLPYPLPSTGPKSTFKLFTALAACLSPCSPYLNKLTPASLAAAIPRGRPALSAPIAVLTKGSKYILVLVLLLLLSHLSFPLSCACFIQSLLGTLTGQPTSADPLCKSYASIPYQESYRKRTDHLSALKY